MEIEYHMPDYHLYDEWIQDEIEKTQEEYRKVGKYFNKSSFKAQFKEYLDYIIDFMTRRCFRRCVFA